MATGSPELRVDDQQHCGKQIGAFIEAQGAIVSSAVLEQN